MSFKYIIAISTMIFFGVSPISATETKCTAQDPEYMKLYMNDVNRRIGRLIPDDRKNAPDGTTAEVTFDIEPDGNAKNVLVTKSSGIKSFDNACLVSINRRSPFRPISNALKVKAVFRTKILELSFDAQK